MNVQKIHLVLQHIPVCLCFSPARLLQTLRCICLFECSECAVSVVLHGKQNIESVHFEELKALMSVLVRGFFRLVSQISPESRGGQYQSTFT